MGRRTKAAHNITVVVPRSGTAAAPKPLLKTVKNEVKKSNRIFQEQQSVSANELASLVRNSILRKSVMETITDSTNSIFVLSFNLGQI
jgi:hypothetical protein